MPSVFLREEETVESLLRRFRAAVTQSGLLRELKERRFFRTKGEKARFAAQRAIRRRRQRARAEAARLRRE